MLQMIRKQLKNNKGFTLIELIIVIAILGILAAIAIPQFSKVQMNSKKKADITTAVNITNAVKTAYENDDVVAGTGQATSVLGSYIEGNPKGQHPLHKGADFTFDVTVDANNDCQVKVYCDAIELYPTVGADWQ